MSRIQKVISLKIHRTASFFHKFCYFSFFLHILTSVNFIWTTHYYCSSSIYDTVETVEDTAELFDNELLMNIKRKRVLNFSNIVFLLAQLPVLALLSSVDDFIREHLKVAIEVDTDKFVYKEEITDRAKKFTKLLHHTIFIALLIISIPLIVEISRIVLCLFLTKCCGMLSSCCDYFLKNFGFKKS